MIGIARTQSNAVRCNDVCWCVPCILVRLRGVACRVALRARSVALLCRALRCNASQCGVIQCQATPRIARARCCASQCVAMCAMHSHAEFNILYSGIVNRAGPKLVVYCPRLSNICLMHFKKLHAIFSYRTSVLIWYVYNLFYLTKRNGTEWDWMTCNGM